MRVVIQRTQKASVEVNQQIISTIDQGLLILLGVEEVDTLDDAQWHGKNESIDHRYFG
jgi:D-tyrosyl-tRNA(Tyr) deacylase